MTKVPYEGKKEIDAIYREVRKILWEEWDPIGVNSLGGPDDEYDSYAGKLVRYLLDGRDEFAIIQYLTTVQTNSMGLSSTDPEHDRQVAQMLLSLKQ